MTAAETAFEQTMKIARTWCSRPQSGVYSTMYQHTRILRDLVDGWDLVTRSRKTPKPPTTIDPADVKTLDTLAVTHSPCTTCGASAGIGCRDPKGTPAVRPHTRRVNPFRKAWDAGWTTAATDHRSAAA